MARKKACGLFVTGTDTGVGKTYVAALIARALVASGRRVGVYKPVASGCRCEGGKLVSDDAVALWEAAGRPGTLEQVCPQRFLAPLAPHLAAGQEGRALDQELLRRGIDFWRENSEIVLVEGAGGLMSPLGGHQYVADLAYDLGYPLVIVSRNALGTINHTLQTLITAAAYPGPEPWRRPEWVRAIRDTPSRPEAGQSAGCQSSFFQSHGLPVAGIVLNEPSPPGDDASLATNRRELAACCGAPILGEVGWKGEKVEGEVDWYGLGSNAPPLLRGLK